MLIEKVVLAPWTSAVQFTTHLSKALEDHALVDLVILQHVLALRCKLAVTSSAVEVLLGPVRAVLDRADVWFTGDEPFARSHPGGGSTWKQIGRLHRASDLACCLLIGALADCCFSGRSGIAGSLRCTLGHGF